MAQPNTGSALRRPCTRYIETLLAELVGIPSACPDEEQVMVRLEREFAEIGVQTQRIPLGENRFNLLARIGEGGPVLCLNAHADTVPPSGRSVPKASIEDGTLRGLGSADDKASIAAMMACLRVLLESGVCLKGTLDLLISADEEGDAAGVRTAISNGYRCDMAVVGEPTNLDVIPTHCGMLFLDLTTHGQATHGSVPTQGVNAIEAMFELLSGLRDVVGRWHGHPLLGPPTLNLGAIQGGDRPNRVPDLCKASVDIRLVPPMTVDAVLEAVDQFITAANSRAEYRVTKQGEPLDTPSDSRLVHELSQAVEAVTGLSPAVSGWRGWTEAEPFRSCLGIESVVFGPGLLEQAHSADEFVELEQVNTAAAVYAETVIRLLT